MTVGLTVLAVDDSRAIRSLLRAILEAAGHEVVTAADASSGLTLLKSLRPDIILTDCKTPDLAGHDFVRRIRTDRRFKSTPIVVVSGAQAAETRAQMAAAGANGWIAKPVSPRDLLGVIEAVQKTRSAIQRPTSGAAMRPTLSASLR